ncbi:MAG: FemAB family PEP-CTERM system-associated protein [candidate division Zixibacteria bacterium]|nr:FemAB family PEP-CTERM system-associated protein [candidate division Zixibacteria bacterium]
MDTKLKTKPTKITDLKVTQASEQDSVSWNQYVDNNPSATFAHRWEWSDILSNSFGIQPYYFIARKNSQVVGVLPTAFMKSILFGKYLISLPWLDYGGAIADDDHTAYELVHRAVNVARENGCEFLEMRAVRHQLPNLADKTDKREFRLDLSEGEEALWKSFNGKARNQVRKAEKAGLSVKFGGAELLDDFYKVFAFNMRDLGTPVWPRELFSEIFRYFPNESEIVIVQLEDKVIAGGLILHYKDYSTVPSASSYRKYLKLCPNNIMYWETIKRCIQRGSKVFDFGRSTEGAGTYKFKKQWLSEPEKQVWQYKLIKTDSLPELNPNNPKFKLAIKIWRKMPLPVANFLGPKIVTKLP